MVAVVALSTTPSTARVADRSRAVATAVPAAAVEVLAAGDVAAVVIMTPTRRAAAGAELRITVCLRRRVISCMSYRPEGIGG
jgi:hypothetical protein